MDSINTFIGGMDKDTSKKFIKPNRMTHSENFSIVTDEKGSSNGAIITPKGNKYLVTIPESPGIVKFEKGANEPIGPWTYSINIMSNTQGLLNLTFGSAVDGWNELFDKLYYEFTTNGNFTWLNVVRVSATEIVIWSDELMFSSQDVSNYDIMTQLASPQTNLKPIGSTYIRDDIYVFTTNNNTDIGGEGQIWKLNYDEESLTASISIVYAGKVNFSLQHPIQAVGRYENPLTHRLYWTDNYNSPRAINVKEKSIMFSNVKMLDIAPIKDFGKLMFDRVIPGGGALPQGMYYISYRYKSQDYVSHWSVPSNGIHIVFASELVAPYFKMNTAPIQYNGNGQPGNTGKAITGHIQNLDPKYAKVELAFIRDSGGASPSIYLFNEYDIPDSLEVTFTLTGNENLEEIALEEFSIYSTVFSSVKSLTSKDNRLIFGNITATEYSELIFNARAYRFKDDGFGNPETYVSSINVDPFLDITTQNDKDAINPYNIDDTQPYKYQTDLITLGGEGPNVKYKFFKEILYGDRKYVNPLGIPQPVKAPLIDQDRALSQTYNHIPGQSQTIYNTWLNYKAPYINHALKGYARGETYRFGIVLYDLHGRPGPVNWIGDIRFPETYDIDTNDADEPSFKIAHNDRGGNTDHYLYALGIEFEVTIPVELQSKVSGYSYVRVERQQRDKTRLGVGILNQCKYLPDNSGDDVYGLSDGLYNEFQGGLGFTSDKYFTLDAPEFLFGKDPSFVPGDILKVIGVLDSGVFTNMGATTPWLTLFHRKLYSCQDPTQAPYNILPVNLKYALDSCSKVDRGGIIFTPVPFVNYNNRTVAGVPLEDRAGGVGLETYFVTLNGTMDWSTDFLLGSAPLDKEGKILVSYERVVYDQYGGNTEADRSKNVYISCGHYYKLLSLSPQTSRVFGGDTYICFYGETKTTYSHNDLTERLIPVNPFELEQCIQFFPVECTTNLELRNGYHAANKHDNIANKYPEGSPINWQTFDEITQYEAYSKDNMNSFFIAYDPTIKNIKEFDSRIWASNEKINGEETDSWRTFSPNEYRDAESEFGPVNNLILFNNEVYFVQDKAFGVALINPLATTSDPNTGDITLGSGETVAKIQYITKRNGCKHQWATTATASALYFLDYNRKRFIRYSGQGVEPLSIIQGMDSWFKDRFTTNIRDNPLLHDGIHLATNRNGEIYTTILISSQGRALSYNLVFSEMAGSFSSFYSLKTPLYLTDNVSLLSTDGSDIYICNKGNYGQFNGVYYPSKVSVVSNMEPTITKTFDNISMDTELYQGFSNLNSTFDKIKVENDYQSSGEQQLISRRSEREWHLYVPRSIMVPGALDITNITNLNSSQLYKERMRDKYMLLELTKENSDNKRFVVNYVKTSFRQSQI